MGKLQVKYDTLQQALVTFYNSIVLLQQIKKNSTASEYVILVHKDNETINFYSRIGLTENLTMDEKKVLEKHFQEQMDIEKKKINKGI